jgi:hypothetical protein
VTQIDAIWIFWLPLLLLFLTTAVGAIVKNRARDACLKRFHGCLVLMKTDEGRWFWGELHVFSTCLELRFCWDSARGQDYLKRSYIFYEPEMQTIASMFRVVRCEKAEEDRRWKKEINELVHGSPGRRLGRQARNVLNILRDAFSQSIGLLIGLAKTKAKVAAVPSLDQRGSELGKHLLAVVPNAYEPVLEKYRGHEVVVQSIKPGFLNEQAAILEEYTERFILVRDVPAPSGVPEQALAPYSACHFDAIHARRLVVVRHLAEKVEPLPPKPTPAPGPLAPPQTTPLRQQDKQSTGTLA